MAIPLLRLAGDGQHVEATLWHRVGRRSLMIWPLWERPLDLAAIQTLIEHPCLAPAGQKLAIRNDGWSALGIFAVYGAERQRISGRNFAGVLAPCPVAVETG
jgi:CRISPR-associated endonuclease/helicase Cas3